MERQFILRLPNSLMNIDLTEAILTKLNDSKVVLEYKSKRYPGIIYQSPTIMESQKVLDNKLYKVADIASIMVIYNEEITNEELYRHMVDKNGQNAGSKEAPGNSNSLELNISDSHSKMLMEEALLNSKILSDVFEREIEINSISGFTPPMKNVKERRFKNNQVKRELVEEIERKVEELLREDSRADRVEYSTQESEEIDMMAAELEELLESPREDFKNDYNSTYTNAPVDGSSAGNSSKASCTSSQRKEELLEKIREKEELHNKAANPILKKRFEQQKRELEEELKKI